MIYKLYLNKAAVKRFLLVKKPQCSRSYCAFWTMFKTEGNANFQLNVGKNNGMYFFSPLVSQTPEFNLRSTAFEQLFSNFSLHWKDLFYYRSLDPTPRFSDSVGLEWSPIICIASRFQVMLLLLRLLKVHTSKITALKERWGKIFNLHLL